MCDSNEKRDLILNVVEREWWSSGNSWHSEGEKAGEEGTVGSEADLRGHCRRDWSDRRGRKHVATTTTLMGSWALGTPFKGSEWSWAALPPLLSHYHLFLSLEWLVCFYHFCDDQYENETNMKIKLFTKIILFTYPLSFYSKSFPSNWFFYFILFYTTQ